VKRLLALAAVTVTAGIATAELLGPGTYRGEYEIDRWGRHLFGAYFVSADVAKILKPYQGRSVAANVAAIDQEDGWGRVTLLKVSSVDVLTNAPNLRLTIDVPRSPERNARTPIVLAFTNTSSEAVYLWPGWDKTDLFLAGGPTNQTPGLGTLFQSFRFRTDVLVAHGTQIEAARESPGGPERVRVLPGGSFRIEVTTKTPLPEGKYQAWWRIYHTAGPVSGYPARSPRVNFDVPPDETNGTTKPSTATE
jgi:hypothetical protein